MASSDRLRYKLETYQGSLKLRHYGEESITYIFNMAQAAEFCECDPATIRRWIDIGQLKAMKTCNDEEIPPEKAMGGRLYFFKEDLIKALRISLGVPTEGFNA